MAFNHIILYISNFDWILFTSLLGITMGKHFGNLIKISGMVTYSLSPFEQRAFAGAISKGVPNMWRRFTGQVFRVVPRTYIFFF